MKVWISETCLHIKQHSVTKIDLTFAVPTLYVPHHWCKSYLFGYFQNSTLCYICVCVFPCPCINIALCQWRCLALDRCYLELSSLSWAHGYILYQINNLIFKCCSGGQEVILVSVSVPIYTKSSWALTCQLIHKHRKKKTPAWGMKNSTQCLMLQVWRISGAQLRPGLLRRQN